MSFPMVNSEFRPTYSKYVEDINYILNSSSVRYLYKPFINADTYKLYTSDNYVFNPFDIMLICCHFTKHIKHILTKYDILNINNNAIQQSIQDYSNAIVKYNKYEYVFYLAEHEAMPSIETRFRFAPNLLIDADLIVSADLNVSTDLEASANINTIVLDAITTVTNNVSCGGYLNRSNTKKKICSKFEQLDDLIVVNHILESLIESGINLFNACQPFISTSKV